ncbi:MAG: ABC transporter ATP-binding protein [Spirochaetaceae bacterium]|nr:ABC transporter ATP-binding protein [Spirochaetaceae bacterium]
MMPLLEVRNLSVGVMRGGAYLPAVDAVSFQMHPGEVLGLAGESGCGKTLTARSVLRLLPKGAAITGGDIFFNGISMGGLSQKELRGIRGNEISMIFQEPVTSLNPLLKIGRQIGEPLELHGQKNRKLIRAETLEAMRKAGLPDPEKLADAYPYQLSGGMCQRVMIALAVIGKPKLLIADEPTTALDAAVQAQIVQLLKTINRELGTAILFISHDLDLINRLCDRAMIMYAGKLLEAGDAESLFTKPQHEYTKGLIGSIPAQERKGKPLRAIPGKAPSLEEIARSPGGCPFAPRCSRAEPLCSAGFPEKTVLKEQHYVYCRLAPERNG